jgi:hypothetical protein
MLNEQEIFDKVSTHLLTQMKVASNGHNCCYRVNELSCAIGCLILDELYSTRIEGMGVQDALFVLGRNELDNPIYTEHRSVLFKRILIHSGIDVDKHKELLTELQSIHDEFTPIDWAEQLKLVGQRFHLEIPKIILD